MLKYIEPELIAAVVPFVLASLDAARRYYQNEDVQLHELPWVEFRAIIEYLRRKFFTVDKPEGRSFVLEGYTVNQLKKELGKQGVRPNHFFSYVYEGEQFNGIFYYLDYDRVLEHRQIHIRAFDHPDGVEIIAHEEACYWHHPVKHLKGTDMEHEKANQWVRDKLEDSMHVGYPSD